MKNSYREAGVDVEAGYEVVKKIKPLLAKTHQPGVMNEIGQFGACFDLSIFNYKEPVLVSGTDGVGTKLLLAQEWEMHDTIGIDCVGMCVNDIIAQGAKPLYFLDYIATGKVDVNIITEIMQGLASGCQVAKMALVGGETAEMPDMYQENHYDIAGVAVGMVEKQKMIDGSQIVAGDVLIGLGSSGIHSNGFSLVRQLIGDKELSIEEKMEIMAPTTIYVDVIFALLEKYSIKGIAHITGGGFYENIPRMLPENCCAEISDGSWDLPNIFEKLAQWG